MLSQKRHEMLLAYLNEHKAVKVSEASELLGVTEKTIRLDLEMLEHKKLLRRVHGGAVLEETKTSLFPVEGRKLSHMDKKQEIAEKALSHIEKNEVILLDGGSTALALARLLGDFPVSVLTNDIQVAHELYPKENVQLVMLGGVRLENSPVIYSQQTTDMLESMFVQKLFLGATGVSLEHGLTVLKSYHTEWKKQAIRSSNETILLADSTKFGQVGLMRFAQIEEVDMVITDSSLELSFKEAFKEKNIKVL
ncbi:DeoR/GlpR family DNA-binding transcription regulator [Alkalihalobacillus sp. 1P02AB]|uniref:DeoR/GlpR family DNA-binding transcription regulator n=1 Tax=Alkalihalobacillus sp. 1P02AB TaxID=3132260 RepID=UPI0039A483E1